jgi:hypothetical protein
MIEQKKQDFLNPISFGEIDKYVIINDNEKQILIEDANGNGINGKKIIINLHNAKYIVQTYELKPEFVYKHSENEMCINLIEVAYENSYVAIKVCGDGEEYELKVTDDGFTIHSIPLLFK